MPWRYRDRRSDTLTVTERWYASTQPFPPPRDVRHITIHSVSGNTFSRGQTINKNSSTCGRVDVWASGNALIQRTARSHGPVRVLIARPDTLCKGVVIQTAISLAVAGLPVDGRTGTDDLENKKVAEKKISKKHRGVHWGARDFKYGTISHAPILGNNFPKMASDGKVHGYRTTVGSRVKSDAPRFTGLHMK